jgi:carbonic anhydrase
VVKHTGCGMLTFKNADAVAIVEKQLGPAAAQELQATSLDFLPFADLEQAVKDDVAYLTGSALVPHSVAVSGWVYEVETGRTRRVV